MVGAERALRSVFVMGLRLSLLVVATGAVEEGVVDRQLGLWVDVSERLREVGEPGGERHLH